MQIGQLLDLLLSHLETALAYHSTQEDTGQADSLGQDPVGDFSAPACTKPSVRLT